MPVVDRRQYLVLHTLYFRHRAPVVDGRRYLVRLEHFAADGSLDATRSPEEVSCGALGRGDLDVVRVILIHDQVYS